jgi:AcrR family transcriptional regulator
VPKIVDHEARRREIVDAYLAVLGREGTARTTGRTVAAELGLTPGTLWHYFDSIEQIAEAAARRGVLRTVERIAQRTAGQRGLDALLGIAEEVLPLDPTTRAEAQVVVAFWGTAEPLAAPGLRLGRVPEFEALTTTALREAVDDGDLVAATPIRALVRLLDSVYAGEQVIAVADAGDRESEDHRAAAELCLRPWAATDAVRRRLRAWASVPVPPSS